jgi:hypothetical protein
VKLNPEQQKQLLREIIESVYEDLMALPRAELNAIAKEREIQQDNYWNCAAQYQSKLF